MNLNKIVKKVFNRNKDSELPKSESNKLVSLFDKLLEEVTEKSDNYYSIASLTTYSTYDEIKAINPDEKVSLVFEVANELKGLRISQSKRNSYSDKKLQYRLNTYEALLNSMLRMKMEFSDKQLIDILTFFKECASSKFHLLSFTNWPVGFTIIQIEKHVKRVGLSDELSKFIEEAIKWSEFNESVSYWGSDVQKAKQKLVNIIHTDDSVAPYLLKEDDVLGKVVNDSVKEIDESFREVIYEIFHLSLTASSGKPTKKFLKTSKELISKIDSKKFKDCIKLWFETLIKSSEFEQTHTSNFNGREYTYSTFVFLSEKNAILVKGLAWMQSHFHDIATLDLLSRLVERSFKKIPNVGPTCASVGNACIYSLAQSKGLDGICKLSQLKLRITQNNTRKLIEKYIEENAKKRGLTPSELEELSVPDFGLKAGVKEEKFEDYTAVLSVTGIGKTSLQWITKDGKNQKSVPASVKNSKKLSDKLKKLKSLAKQVQKSMSAQRDRIDRLYIESRVWNYEDFNKYYLEHGLISFIAEKLIWILNDSSGNKTSAIWQNDKWEDVKGVELKGIDDNTKVELWHPIVVDQQEVLEWRDRLEKLSIKQPMKQAFREVYILTDAEIKTKSYSNRMAAHIIKQHQFNALAGVRGWKYSLLGAYDHGREGAIAEVNLPTINLTCQYWINELYSEDDFNDAGIWDYIATDQVRFLNETGSVVDLIDIPEIVFSETMRDVDLFVGVCSVGNDPEWLDRGGSTDHRDYWTSYSFGDLNEVSKTRKVVLERLVPRLKIRDKVKIDGRFLIVKGSIREYKIHIGSTNILMKPNDEYLCIVPARKSNSDVDKVYLPFEGDRGLSLVLSKAMLLAEDHKITDPTILSQINRKN